MNPNFDDSKWPRAFEYLDQEVGFQKDWVLRPVSADRSAPLLP
jgi:hypothetical protein